MAGLVQGNLVDLPCPYATLTLGFRVHLPVLNLPRRRFQYKKVVEANDVQVYLVTHSPPLEKRGVKEKYRHVWLKSGFVSWSLCSQES